MKSPAQDRRCGERVPQPHTTWQIDALLRPGLPVRLVNISERGALVEARDRMRPGARTELQLAGPGTRQSMPGRVDRCHIAGLDPLCYRGAVLFDDRLDLATGVAEGVV